MPVALALLPIAVSSLLRALVGIVTFGSMASSMLLFVLA
jgi:hypothetical protein